MTLSNIKYVEFQRTGISNLKPIESSEWEPGRAAALLELLEAWAIPVTGDECSTARWRTGGCSTARNLEAWAVGRWQTGGAIAQGDCRMVEWEWEHRAGIDGQRGTLKERESLNDSKKKSKLHPKKVVVENSPEDDFEESEQQTGRSEPYVNSEYIECSEESQPDEDRNTDTT
nr:hypothetical protein Iba_chr09aCG12720 [Ipomoea batatas]